MRPGQNKRMRGRNNNNNGNRKGPNPLTRSYESNGPDVKIRGTAQHIGEKYLQLARDAQTSGDPVAAESYLQHAEHYFRIIAAAYQAQQQAQVGFVRQPGDAELDDADEDEDSGIPDRFASPAERTPQPQSQPFVPQPFPERQVNQNDRQDRGERSDGQDRGFRQDRAGYDRDGRQERQGQDRQGQERSNHYDRANQPDRGFEQNRSQPPRFDRPDRNNNRPNRFPRDGQDHRDGRESRDMQYREQPRITAGPRDPEPRGQPTAAVVQSEPDLPSFITAPVRVAPQADLGGSPPIASDGGGVAAGFEDAGSDAALESFSVRPRRRRRPRLASSGDGDFGVEPTAGEGSDS